MVSIHEPTYQDIIVRKVPLVVYMHLENQARRAGLSLDEYIIKLLTEGSGYLNHEYLGE